MSAPRQTEVGLAALSLRRCYFLAGSLGAVASPDRSSPTRRPGLAINGFDPVAYFTEATARQGRVDTEYRLSGATWRFRNEGNRAAFADNPEVYMPQFGGYDPVAIARGTSVAGTPAGMAGDRPAALSLLQRRGARGIRVAGAEPFVACRAALARSAAQPAVVRQPEFSPRSPQAMKAGTRKSRSARPYLQRLALRVGHGAAGGSEHRVAGGDVPLAGGGQPRIEIDHAFRDPAELHRRSAAALRLDRAEFLEERLRVRIEMRAADQRRRSCPSATARTGSAAAASALSPVEPQALRTLCPTIAAPDQCPAPEREHDAGERRAAAYDRDVDGELVTAGQEFACAVQRIDQDEASPSGATSASPLPPTRPARPAASARKPVAG